MSVRVGIVAGELSGDTLAAGLVEAVRRRRPDVVFEGVTGPGMRAAGVETLVDVEALAVMGLTEIVRELPRLLKLRRSLVARWRAEPPALVIGVDAPDFNLGLLKRLRRRGQLTLQYVCPSVWAWREGRVKTIRRAADAVLCLLPFEPAFLKRHGITGHFVGHPLADRIAHVPDRSGARQRLGFDAAATVVALLPGSRHGEFARLAPAFLATAAWLSGQRPEICFVAPMASEALAAAFRDELERHPALPVTVATERTHDALAAADAVLIASGTATLEAALFKCPMVVAYAVAESTYRLVRSLNLIKLDHYSLPNLLAGRELVPEFIQHAIEPEALGRALLGFIDEPAAVDVLRDEFAKLHDVLACDASERAADVVLALLGSVQTT